MRITLIGDSIIDNVPYVRENEDVLAQLKTLRPDDEFVKHALDGAITSDALRQTRLVRDKPDALVVSAGGNDALGQIQLLTSTTSLTFRQAMEIGRDIREQFHQDYAALMDRVSHRNTPALVFTIYNPRFHLYDEADALQTAAEGALSFFNDVIQQEALAHDFDVLDLRRLCNDDCDFANAIEPSEQGGRKIAEAVISWLQEPG